MQALHGHEPVGLACAQEATVRQQVGLHLAACHAGQQLEAAWPLGKALQEAAEGHDVWGEALLLAVLEAVERQGPFKGGLLGALQGTGRQPVQEAVDAHGVTAELGQIDAFE